MTRIKTVCFFMLWCGLVLTGNVLAEQRIHHGLEVILYPDQQRLTVVDHLHLGQQRAVSFELNSALAVVVEGGTLTLLPADGEATATKRYALQAPTGQVTLRYSGTLPQIDNEGIYLDGASAWYPRIDNQNVSFRLDVTLPPQWRAVSQGKRIETDFNDDAWRSVWQEGTLQQEIYLIAARFSEYSQTLAGLESLVFLRQPDKALAQRYLDVTAQYIDLYRQLIGPYPYAKFALVENVWESGYGMPSFTLLGPKVIRLPFILHSSYPHEILHNWWGNSVYVDYPSGNWAEGLTSYLADHLIQEQRQQGASFRRNILQGYADFVSQNDDFAINEFRTRHSASSEAIGYGKTQMFFHMLRQQLGDEAFIKGLRLFYSQHKFTTAGFDDLARVFSKASNRELSSFFNQWVSRPGAPQLQLSRVRSQQTTQGWQLTGTLRQKQKDEAFTLSVPVAVTLEGQNKAQQVVLSMDNKELAFSIPLVAKPLRIDIDPEFDLFRRVDRAEIPPALSQAFGAEKMLLVLPSQATISLQRAYQALAQSWQRMGLDIELALDRDLELLPDDRAVWLLGWHNTIGQRLGTNLAVYDVTVRDKKIKLNGNTYTAKKHALILSTRKTARSNNAIIWLAADNVAAIAGLARKLPHYRKYSYLVFKGDEVTNTVKGQWPVINSPMSDVLEKDTDRATLSARPSLVDGL